MFAEEVWLVQKAQIHHYCRRQSQRTRLERWVASLEYERKATKKRQLSNLLLRSWLRDLHLELSNICDISLAYNWCRVARLIARSQMNSTSSTVKKMCIGWDEGMWIARSKLCTLRFRPQPCSSILKPGVASKQQCRTVPCSLKAK